MIITNASLQIKSTLAVAGGGFGDVFQGEFDGRPAAIKVMRLWTTSDLDEFLSVRTTPRAAHIESALKPSFTEVLPRSCRLEAPTTPKRSTVVWCDV